MVIKLRGVKFGLNFVKIVCVISTSNGRDGRVGFESQM